MARDRELGGVDSFLQIAYRRDTVALGCQQETAKGMEAAASALAVQPVALPCPWSMTRLSRWE